MDSGDSALTALDSVEELFRARALAGVSPGLAFAVGRDGRLLLAGGHGTADEAGTRPGAATAFRIASCTKSVTAAAILLLRDRGALHLDDPALLHLPAAAGLRVPPGYPEITLRMLLTMSAGLATDNEWADRQESISPRELDDMLARGVRWSHPPGTAYEYSNLGYAVLGRVIERIAEQPFRAFVHRELLDPLQLASTGFDERVAASGGVATGYRRTVDGTWSPQPFSGPGAFSPIGGLFSTARDLARWAGWLSAAFTPTGAIGAGAAGDGAAYDAWVGDGSLGTSSADAVLSRASRREMQQIARAIPSPTDAVHPVSRGYGFGLNVTLHPRFGAVVGHSGGYPGFGSHMRWHPESGLAVIVFENATYADAATPAAGALELLLEEFHRPVPALWPETAAARDLVERMLRGRSPSPPAGRFSSNVPLDVPWAERRRGMNAALAEVGPLLPERPLDQVLLRVGSPAHILWRVPAERGELECEVSLHPLDPPLIQALRVSVRTPGAPGAP
ncbi:serine hydrolase domain-containing protein [Planctomonas deserti]|uniref:serine hydrolase domain-containing protein n=1 Tax=Planctomonas deserti TaxID=2144185 RepID=UPI000D3DB989|nr:serine hydrolase domain-containing protein [Planctomonas deserti]